MSLYGEVAGYVDRVWRIIEVYADILYRAGQIDGDLIEQVFPALSGMEAFKAPALPQPLKPAREL